LPEGAEFGDSELQTTRKKLSYDVKINLYLICSGFTNSAPRLLMQFLHVMTDEAAAENHVERTPDQLSAQAVSVQVSRVEEDSDGNSAVLPVEDTGPVVIGTRDSSSARSSVCSVDSKRVTSADQLQSKEIKQRCALCGH